MTLNIIKERVMQASRIVVYGPPGVGKSTFACGAPGVLALDYEDGLAEIGPDRVKGPATWTHSLTMIQDAVQSSYKTLVIDTVDKLEEQATTFVCRRGVKGKAMTDLGAFGYGDGYTALVTEWRTLLSHLEAARGRGIDVVLVAHIQAKSFEDPAIGNYNKWIAQLSKQSWGATHRWADAVLFATYEQSLIDGRAVMTGKRILRTVAGTGYDAKNRWHLPETLPLSWSAFSEARAAGSRSPDTIRDSILRITTDVTRSKAEAYIAEAAEDVSRLLQIETALKNRKV